jgi:hypothetical protein
VIGQGIAFAGLCFASAWLEISGQSAGGLWVIVFFWWLFGNWMGDRHQDRG